MTDDINEPSHYTCSDIEPIDAIEAWELGFHLGNVVKYIARAKHKGSELEDLQKAQWYLDRYIENLENTEPEHEVTVTISGKDVNLSWGTEPPTRVEQLKYTTDVKLETSGVDFDALRRSVATPDPAAPFDRVASQAWDDMHMSPKVAFDAAAAALDTESLGLEPDQQPGQQTVDERHAEAYRARRTDPRFRATRDCVACGQIRQHWRFAIEDSPWNCETCEPEPK